MTATGPPLTQPIELKDECTRITMPVLTPNLTISFFSDSIVAGWSDFSTASRSLMTHDLFLYGSGFANPERSGGLPVRAKPRMRHSAKPLLRVVALSYLKKPRIFGHSNRSLPTKFFLQKLKKNRELVTKSNSGPRFGPGS